MVEVLWERHIGSVMFYLLDMAHERRQLSLSFRGCQGKTVILVRKTTLDTVER